jgi:Tol biopolymer transport system component
MPVAPEQPAEIGSQRKPSRWYVIWFKAITRPTLGNFHNLLSEPKAGLGRALLWVVLSGIGGGLLSWVVFPGVYREDLTTGRAAISLQVDLSVLIGGMVTFTVYLLLQNLLALALGGHGRITQLAFLSAAYIAPLIILSGLLSGLGGIISGSSYPYGAMGEGTQFTAGVIPDSTPWFFMRNILLSLILFGYSVVALRAVHQLGIAKAFLAAFAPTLLAVCVTSGITAFMWWEQLPKGPTNVRPDEHSSIYMMDAQGGNLRRLTDNAMEDTLPVWSPDGRQIAFSSNRDGNWEIYVMNSDGSRQTRLTNDPADDVIPAWSPDGKQIAFVSARDGNADVYVMNADGREVRRLTDNPANDQNPVWSPDGKRLSFDSFRDGNQEIYVMNADGSGQIRLTDNPSNDGAPSWSPNGRQIAFGSNRTDAICIIGECDPAGPSRIFIMNADGSGIAPLTAGEANDLLPVWSPSGIYIAFISDRDGNDEIYVMKVDGSGQINLTHSSGKDGIPSWSPDGKWITFASARAAESRP